MEQVRPLHLKCLPALDVHEGVNGSVGPSANADAGALEPRPEAVGKDVVDIGVEIVELEDGDAMFQEGDGAVFAGPLALLVLGDHDDCEGLF